MENETLWYALAALFGAAGLANLARSRRRSLRVARARVALGLASFVWGAAALLYRFAGPGPGYAAAAMAAAIMLAGAYASARSPDA